MRRIWASSIDSDAIDLAPPEARHLRDVLRARVGDDVVVFDGEGRERPARVESVGPRGLRLRPVGPALASERAPGPEVELVVSLLKGDAMDRVVRGATELGVHAFLPLVAERSVVRPRPRQAERWRKIAREAARQSGRSRIPSVAEPAELAALLAALPDGRRIVLIEGTRADRLSVGPSDRAILAVGPEGGFAPSEVETLLAAGFEPSGLSDAVLRAETAALAAVALARRGALKGGAGAA